MAEEEQQAEAPAIEMIRSTSSPVELIVESEQRPRSSSSHHSSIDIPPSQQRTLQRVSTKDGGQFEIDPEFLPSDEEENERVATELELARRKREALRRRVLSQFPHIRQEEAQLIRIRRGENSPLRDSPAKKRKSRSKQSATLSPTPAGSKSLKLNVSVSPVSSDPLRKKIKGGAISLARRDFSPRETASTVTPGPAMLPYLEFHAPSPSKPVSRWCSIPNAEQQRFSKDGTLKPRDFPQAFPFFQSNVEAVTKRVHGGRIPQCERRT